MQKPSNKFN
ncbi:hypothetical protein CGLO_00005 [Colletotrichum gloeosporioides Cg-14]|uniref:Uncharacterized protein n=1 Tax=Colletotrichum gloeosporioides (strain Cg-14) TaxID=1237896 RepID=T0L4Y3_COLGC|nr:hypothetical protein CGLO_00005 [Colletotrichum gloeosporioides Cg-14]